MSEPWSHRTVLVTGASGLVGSHLIARLLDLGAPGISVVAFIRDPDPASPLWLSGDIARVAVAAGRLEHYDEIRTAIVEREVDTVFHLGAQAIVAAGRRDPRGTFESNIRGTYNLLEACRLHGDLVQRIIIASSDKAYGEADRLPCTEVAPLAARNPYDVSKSCTDLIAQAYATSYGLPIAIARCGNIFGPGDLNWSRIVPGTIRSILEGSRPVIRSDGTPVRDYLYVGDAAAAYLALASWLDGASAAADRQRAFNFSSGEPLNVMQMVRRIARACGREDLEPVIEGRAAGEISEQALDSSRACTVLSWRAAEPLDRALHHTAQWYRWYLKRRAAGPACSAAPPAAPPALACVEHAA
jgi:CDP-glucose 4,6-dehydratase